MNSSRPTVAVALATHNGAQFLGRQLESIAAQTRLPDELVIEDDGSTDETVNIVERFAERAAFPVRLHRAVTPRGHSAAFLSAAYRSRADLIAFCDQDDIWSRHKLAVCVAEFERRRGVTLVAHTGRVVGANRFWIAGRYPRYLRRWETDPRSAPASLWIPGFALVATRELFEIWDVRTDPPMAEFGGPEAWGHDTWASFIGTALGTVVLLPDPLVSFRQHGDNVHGAPMRRTFRRIQSLAERRHREADHFETAAAQARRRATLLDELCRRLAERPYGTAVFDLDGPQARAALWIRLGEANERRGALYSVRPLTVRCFRILLTNVASLDYRAPRRGGLGLGAFAEDLLYAAGLLDVALTVLRSSWRIARGP